MSFHISPTQLATVNVAELIGRQKIGPFQIGVVALCAAAMFADGFDVQVMGYVAPAVSRTWAIAPGTLGWLLSAGLIGLMVGSLLWTPLADRIGRKPVLILSLLIFGLGSLATPLAQSVDGLFWFRVATGLGLGGVMPNCVALTSEYSPRKLRTTMIMVATFGFTIGGGFGGAIAAYLISAYGWPAAFYFGGIMPLVMVPVLFLVLPESVCALTTQNGQESRIAAILKRLNPALDYDPARTRFVISEEKSGAFPLKTLFTGGRGRITLLLWVMFFMNLLDMYFLSNWMPTLLHKSGMPEATAILATTLIHLGGLAGGLVMGAFADKVGVYTVLLAGYLLAGVFTAALGPAGASVPLVVAASFGAGFCITGSQLAANSLAAAYYPTEARATGVGWALGIGRIGSIVGPVIAGLLVAAQWTTPAIFAAAALPAVIAAIAVFVLGRMGGDPSLDPEMIGEPAAE